MRNLAEITVDLNFFDDPDVADPMHAEIVVEAADVVGDLHAFGYPTTTEIVTAYNYVAGILGRVAFVLTPHVVRAGIEHGCCPGALVDAEADWRGGCHVTGTVETLADPSYDTGNPPAIWINVPREQAPMWLKKTQGLLGGVSKALAWVDPEDAKTAPLRAIPGGSQ